MFLDVIIIVPLLIGAWKGFRKGFIIEACTLIALALGIYGGIHFSGTVANLIQEYIGNKKYLPIASFTVTFILISVVVFIIGKVLEKIINFIALKMVNKLLGLGFGVLKYLLIISVIIMVVNNLNSKLELIPEETTSSSVLYTPILTFSKEIIPRFEEHIGEKNLSNSLNIH